jgi:hypothetical protein
MFWRRFEKFEPAIIAVLFLAYLGGTAALALTQDRQFFVNDVLAIAIWLVVGLVLLISRSRTRQR